MPVPYPLLKVRIDGAGKVVYVVDAGNNALRSDDYYDGLDPKTNAKYREISRIESSRLVAIGQAQVFWHLDDDLGWVTAERGNIKDEEKAKFSVLTVYVDYKGKVVEAKSVNDVHETVLIDAARLCTTENDSCWELVAGRWKKVPCEGGC